MARYVVERTFPEGLGLPISDEGEAAAQGIIGYNADVQVTWTHSYVNWDKQKTVYIYDGPTLEAIRQAAERNGLRIDRIHQSLRPRPVLLPLPPWRGRPPRRPCRGGSAGKAIEARAA
jgi:hypothetical protein